MRIKVHETEVYKGNTIWDDTNYFLQEAIDAGHSLGMSDNTIFLIVIKSQKIFIQSKYKTYKLIEESENHFVFKSARGGIRTWVYTLEK